MGLSVRGFVGSGRRHVLSDVHATAGEMICMIVASLQEIGKPAGLDIGLRGMTLAFPHLDAINTDIVEFVPYLLPQVCRWSAG